MSASVHKILCPEQFATRKKHSSDMLAFAVSSLIQHAKSTGTELFILFIWISPRPMTGPGEKGFGTGSSTHIITRGMWQLPWRSTITLLFYGPSPVHPVYDHPDTTALPRSSVQAVSRSLVGSANVWAQDWRYGWIYPGKVGITKCHGIAMAQP